ncbi:DNA-directed RNA polymerase subunit beta [Laceyella putida]|uniref:DNA-directed RNA polymerase subunit beta n=1 Tax=Laceyella putida TaxID=110101 RepID=A0ABW2RGC7_9BACL
MSYPDKNQDKKWDQTNPTQREEAKSSLTEATQQPEPKEKESKETKDTKDTLPVGLLKWSKDEEEEQDTHLCLDKSHAEDSNRDEDQNKKKPLIRPIAQVNPLSSAADQEDGSEMDEPVQTSHSPSGQAERNLSLEDTLTPIDFKEYSLTPSSETDKEPEIQYKQPSYTVDFSKDIAMADEDDREPITNFAESGSEERKGGKYREEELEEQDVALEGRPVWMTVVKIAWLPVTLIVVLIVGLMVGHAVIGNQPAGDVFDMNMWEHIYQLLFSK